MSVPRIFVQGYGARHRIRIMPSIDLRRLDPSRNMRRLYRLDIEADLFGGVLLLKAWGRIGTRGRVTAERHDSEAPALAALQKQAERKRRRGYTPREPQMF
jgi:predicted DNA-binding WGR domain protein